MVSLSVAQARLKLDQLLAQAAESHEPIHISGEHCNALLISEEDWRGIQETLYLLSIPKMRESIRKGMTESLSESSVGLDWLP